MSPTVPTMKAIYNQVKPLEPEQFLNVNTDVSTVALDTLKNLYDFTKYAEGQGSDPLHSSLPITADSSVRSKKKRKLTKSAITEAPLQHLITESFDSGQIWEELQLQNGLMYESLVSSISKALAHAKALQSQVTEIESRQRQRSKQKLPVEQFEEEGSDSEIEFESNARKSKKVKKLADSKSKSKVYSKSQVDDKFFNLAQMTEFLEQVETEIEAQNHNDGVPVDDSDVEEESIDLFAAMDDNQNADDEDTGVYYDQFFDRPLDEVQGDADTTAHLQPEDDGDADLEDDYDDVDVNEDPFDVGESREPANSSSSDDDDELELDDSTFKKPLPANLSSFEKRRQAIDASIDQMEQEALEPKGWQFQGEVTAEKRPENSLLEEHLAFDHLLRQAPEITVKTTLKLEDIMKQRIKDQAWDDVERKAKPKETPVEYKNKLVLDSEKSKQSLAQLYEQEYITKQKSAEGANDVETIPEEEVEISKGLKTLFAKLDALSNFHYTPKPAVSDIKVVTNLPSIAMEEVAPVSVSDATLLAPQEIQAPIKSSLKSTAERDQTDKKRDRRQKKKKQHLKRVDREERARIKGLGLRNVKLAENIVTSSMKGNKGKDEDNLGGRSKELKTSKAFFDRLQDKVQTQIKEKVAKSKKVESKGSTAKKFKL